jgi:hypothetical protein
MSGLGGISRTVKVGWRWTVASMEVSDEIQKAVQLIEFKSTRNIYRRK